MLFFKVFGEDVEWLECCPKDGNNDSEASCGELALGCCTSSSNGVSLGPSSSDDNYDEPHAAAPGPRGLTTTGCHDAIAGAS